MDQKFKLNFDMMRDGKTGTPPGTPPAQEPGIIDKEYPDAGHIRNLSFVLAGGRRIFLSYNYLVATEFLPGENIISVTFTSHTVILRGIGLGALYYKIMQQMVREIVCTDQRYNALYEKHEPVVNEIDVSKS